MTLVLFLTRLATQSRGGVLGTGHLLNFLNEGLLSASSRLR
jgi:hypothetical protein